jgi:hypothetical protein
MPRRLPRPRSQRPKALRCISEAAPKTDTAQQHFESAQTYQLAGDLTMRRRNIGGPLPSVSII